MGGFFSQRRLARFHRDERGGVLVEFALLAPLFFTLLIGVLQIGMQIQNWNAIRNLASDGARFAVVEYQRGHASQADLISTWMRSRGVGSRYNFNTDRLGITVTSQTSRIADALEMQISVTYDAPDYLAFVPGNLLQIKYKRPVFLLKDS